MARRSALFWAVLAVAVVGALIYGPAYLAGRATAEDGPVDFASQPLEGWSFLIEAVREVPDAAAGSPEQARQIAVDRFADGTVVPLEVELYYLPDRRLSVGEGQGSRDLTTKAKLIWNVAGRQRPGGEVETIGLIDLATGAVIYDVREQ